MGIPCEILIEWGSMIDWVYPELASKFISATEQAYIMRDTVLTYHKDVCYRHIKASANPPLFYTRRILPYTIRPSVWMTIWNTIFTCLWSIELWCLWLLEWAYDLYVQVSGARSSSSEEVWSIEYNPNWRWFISRQSEQDGICLTRAID